MSKYLCRTFLIATFILLNIPQHPAAKADTDIEDTDFQSKLNELFDKSEVHKASDSVQAPPIPSQSLRWNRSVFGTQKLTKPSYLYSADAIRNLARLEENIYSTVVEYVESLETRISVMKRYIKDYKESSVNNLDHLSLTERGNLIVANPLIAHRLIRRFAVDYVRVEKIFDQDKTNANTFRQKLDELKAGMIYPDAQDHQDSLSSLLRIQKYNNLDTSDMFEGRLGHLEGTVGYLETGIGLSAKDAFDLAAHADSQPIVPHEGKYFSSIIEWYEVAQSKLEHSHSPEDIELKQLVETNLGNAVEKHDRSCEKITEQSFDVEHCFSETIGDKFGSHKPPEYKRIKLSVENQKMSNSRRKEDIYSLHTKRNFMTACSGKSFQDPEERARLRCWYEHKKHPYLTISPAKFELLNESPELFQIYDMIGKRAIEKIMAETSPKLSRSQVINENDPYANQVSEVRTSVQTWVYASDRVLGDLFDSLNRHIEYVTNLNVRDVRGYTSEALQVASYRTSHHYDEHLDAFNDPVRSANGGERIATFMFYLSDVDVGGLTGFPVMGTAGKPVKGSAAFWHNLYKNGSVDKRTWHGGCPVIHGVKWVANKWILMNENWDKRKCSLNPNE